MTVIGFILMAIGGGLLHDVPFPRFIAALMLIIIGDTLIKAGVV